MTPDRNEIITLREEKGMTREQIAEHYDVSVGTVRRWIKDLNIPRPTRRSRPELSVNMTPSGGLIGRIDNGLTSLERAITILGSRFTEDRRKGYMLDGRPANINAILKEAGL